MRRCFALFVTLAALLAGCTSTPEPKADAYVATDLAWPQLRTSDEAAATKDLPYLPVLAESPGKRFAVLDDIWDGLDADGLPQFKAPQGYELLIWQGSQVTDPSPKHLRWLQVYAYPSDWQRRVAEQRLSRQDIGWAFFTNDLDVWADNTARFPCGPFLIIKYENKTTFREYRYKPNQPMSEISNPVSFTWRHPNPHPVEHHYTR